jgi:hypothetical protein
MTALQDFVGTWRSETGAPHVVITFTWVLTDDGLRGESAIEVAEPSAGAAPWMSNRGPRRYDRPIGTPTVEEGRALFSVDGAPSPAEFRLLGGGEAIVGAALDKLPPELAGPEHQRAFEAHRVRLRKI